MTFLPIITLSGVAVIVKSDEALMMLNISVVVFPKYVSFSDIVAVIMYSPTGSVVVLMLTIPVVVLIEYSFPLIVRLTVVSFSIVIVKSSPII